MKFRFFSGSTAALGLAWHLDNGFWNIFWDTFMGWAYVAYELAKHYW